jgi:hypothetical protein
MIPRRLMTSVPGSEYGPGAFAAVRLRIVRIPAIGPAALALGREQRYGCSGGRPTVITVARSTVVLMLRIMLQIRRQAGRHRRASPDAETPHRDRSRSPTACQTAVP